ncbi:MAG: GNAT family N-acetyltransferase [Chitinophagales bacterium]|nr:GNAT family N-acetyltransferase [Bacteroidota bacterium]MCB9021987.1 GNAT family N-acetyltransferase [Chitinophagales bacterium]
MTLKFDIIYSNDIQDKHRSVFGELLKRQGKVKGDLLTKADRCKIICIVTLDEEPIAIGGIKPKTTEDFHKDKADLMNMENSFEWELGYLYTDTNYSGKGIASNVSRILLEQFGKGNIMASTEITANPGMVKILEKCGFRHYGKPWKSGIHENYLGLFLRFE